MDGISDRLLSEVDEMVDNLQHRIVASQRALDHFLRVRDLLRSAPQNERTLADLLPTSSQSTCACTTPKDADSRISPTSLEAGVSNIAAVTSTPESVEQNPVADLRGESIVDAAIAVLRSHPRYTLHFCEVARGAIKRGYAGTGRAKDLEKAAQQSFATILRRRRDVFEIIRRGVVRLAPSYRGKV